MSSKKTIYFLLFFFLLLIFPSKVRAYDFTIDSVSINTISSGNDVVEVKINTPDLPNPSYFRIALQKEEGGDYYGYMQNNSGQWVKILTLSESCSSYYLVEDLSQTSLTLNFKLGEDNILENGSYNFVAHRFTTTACSGSKSRNSLAVGLSLPTATPTTTPTSTTTSHPTATSTQTSTPTIKATIKATIKPTITPEDEITDSENKQEGENKIEPTQVNVVTASPTTIAQVKGEKTVNRTTSLAAVLVSLGAFFLGVGGINLYKKMKLEYNNDSEKNNTQ